MSHIKGSASNISLVSTRTARLVPSVRRLVAMPAAGCRVATRSPFHTSCAPIATAEAPVAPEGPYKIMVAKDGKIHSVAGKIAAGARSNENMEVYCIGPPSTNTAVKSIIVTRGYLTENNLDLSFRPCRRRESGLNSRTSEQFKLELVQNPSRFTPPADQEVVTMSISAKTKAASTAGALAPVVREGRAVNLLAIGAGAVTNAVHAVALARLYLESEGKDLRLVPEFTQVQTTLRGETNAVRMWVLVDNKPQEQAQQ